MLHEHISTTSNDFGPLSNQKIVIPGGAILSSFITADLAARGVNLGTTFGTTETGYTFRTIPPTVENANVYGTLRIVFPDSGKIEMQEVEDGVYELVVHKGLDTAAEMWLDKPANEPWRSGDLFLEEPKGSGNWLLQGRKDDLFVHTDGNTTSAGAMQLDIRAASKVIENAIVLGHARPCTSLLVEVIGDVDPKSEQTAEEVWRVAKEINGRYAGHSRVMRSMICVLPRGAHLPVTPKGNVKRKEVESTFEKEIDNLYRGLEG